MIQYGVRLWQRPGAAASELEAPKCVVPFTSRRNQQIMTSCSVTEIADSASFFVMSTEMLSFVALPHTLLPAGLNEIGYAGQ